MGSSHINSGILQATCRVVFFFYEVPLNRPHKTVRARGPRDLDDTYEPAR